MKIDTTAERSTVHILPDRAALIFAATGEKLFMPTPEFYIEKHVLFVLGKRVVIWQRVMEGDAFITTSSSPIKLAETLIVVLASFVWEGILNWVKGKLKGVLHAITPFSSLLQVELGGFSFSVGIRVASAA